MFMIVKRIEQIDALRGFALFGIIMTHMFEGYLASMTPPQYSGFNMPLKVKLDNQEPWIKPTTNWKHEYTKDTKKELIIDTNFYVAGFRNMK
jgi:hypothetical protein